jgi:hypothetical protein
MTSLAGFHRLSLLALGFFLGFCQPIAAQTANRPFADLGHYLHPGDTIVVARATGEIQGRLVRLSPTSLAIREGQRGPEREIPATLVTAIEKVDTAMGKGALIGALVSVPLAMANGEGCSPNSCGAFVVGTVAVVTGIGAIIGYAHDRRTVVYSTQPGSPTASGAPPSTSQPPPPVPYAAGNARTVHASPVLGSHRAGVMLLVQF